MVKKSSAEGSENNVPKLEGFKVPSFRSVWNGIFADHITWILEPASLLMIFASFKNHQYFYDNRDYFGIDEKWAFSLAMWILPIAIWWVGAISFLILDFVTNEHGKVYKKRTTVPYSRIIPVVIRNHIIHLLICPYLTVKIFDYFNVNPVTPYEETLWTCFVGIILCGLAFEVVFFTCHYLEHVMPGGTDNTIFYIILQKLILQ